MYCSNTQAYDSNGTDHWCGEGAEVPTINQQAFPATPSNLFWSSSPYAYFTNGAWYVHFYNGNVNWNFKNNNNQVRLVRQGLIDGRFLPIEDGSVVRDTVTNLEWQRCSLGQAWNAAASTCDNTATTYTWDNAITQTDGDFVLPSKEQLRTLVYCSNTQAYDSNGNDSSCGEGAEVPTINQQAFPGTPSSWFWSSSPYADYASSAWDVGFGNGNVYWVNKNYHLQVRLVRAGQSLGDLTVTYTATVGGSIEGDSEQTVPFGDDAFTVTAVPDVGYQFVRWNDSIETAARTDTGLEENLTVEAQFELSQYTLTFDSAGGTGVDPITQNFATAVTLPADPTRAGYTFAGWSPLVLATMPAANQTHTAQWTVNQYTLTYTAGTNGSISGTSLQTVSHGGNGTMVTAVPDVGYSFEQWTPDSNTSASRTDTNITADATYTATFTLNAPEAPTGVIPTAGDGQVSLSWSAVTGATSYNIYHSTSVGVTTLIGTKVTNVTSGSAITGLINGTTYYFIVTAVNAAGEGAASSEVSAVPQALDTTPPAVVVGGLTPANGATGVARDVSITADFDEDIFATTVNDTTFTLAGNGSVSGMVSFDGSTNIATFAPDSKMAMLTSHTATLTTGITDLAGNGLASDQTWSFTTADGVWGSTPATVDIDAEDNNGVRVVVDEQGNATTVWLQFNETTFTNNVVANRYVTGSWGVSPVALESGAGDATGVELAVDGNGNVFAVWQQEDGSNVWHIWANRYDAGTNAWGTATMLDSGANDAGQPQVAVDGNGNAIVVWNQVDGSFVNHIWASRYASGIWSAAELIETDTTEGAGFPAIAMDPAGNAIVVWHLGDGFLSGDIMATHYTGGAWNTTAVALETRAAADVGFGAQVAMDSNGNAIAVWVQEDDGAVINVWANRYDAVTEAWGTATVIADGTGNGMDPQVAVDGSGNALVVWIQDNGNDVWSNHFAFATTTWGTAEKLETLAGPTTAPQIAMDATGHGVAVWIQIDDVLPAARSSTFANRYVNGTGWSGAAVIEADDTYDNNITRADLGMNSKGEAMAVWHQMQGSGKFDVWANSFE